VVDRLLLTREELRALTGFERPSRMCAWLRDRGWVHEGPARKGDVPKVARAYHDARMNGTLASPSRRRDGPRLDFMTNAHR
jgi:Domain of unknown function (DUF4224)